MTKILIADDDTEIQELLNFTLENEGYNVVICSDGEEAERRAYAEKPDLIVLDVMMPKMTGYEVCEKLREDPRTALTPIIMLTSLSQTKDKITGIKLGADEYLNKPFEPFELAARIEGLLKRVKAEISANPVTNLSGSTQIEMEIKKLLSAGKNFSLFYIDIDNFKPFNEKYGFDAGDVFLKKFAEVLRNIVSVSREKFFLGHLTADDFVIVTVNEDIEAIANNILHAFNTLPVLQYDENTIQKGYMLSIDKEGKEIKAPLMTASIGIAQVSSGNLKHFLQVIEKAKDLCRDAKNTGGNKYIFG
ncbi:MAG: hypothetical protein A2252_10665 [Elusimicrobia bacterium RIFOXYA2_FULL_39_19]|nr:MAG: hypothetical protein A2252_10665 [Elusimicrobia bacterium RIFOXYA2_FULL_39_19]